MNSEKQGAKTTLPTPAPQQTDQVEIVYYTDPLCCWSWAFEPQWRRLRYEYRDKIRWRYCMGGLISDWKSFHDPMNVITRPAQMGPLWMEARHISGMKIQDRIWMEDPPASSYPACIAVKCAELQSAAAGERYLRALREAVMLHGQNIARQEVLLQVAETLALQAPLIFDVVKFAEDLSVGAGRAAFRKDLQNVRYHNIGRFPTLTLCTQQTGVIIVGYRPYSVLLKALEQVAPDLQPVQPLENIDDYASYWSSVTERELLEANMDLKNDV